MNKQQLSNYRNRVTRINKLKEDIEELKARDVPIVAGKVQSSMQEHPYIQCRASVQMDDPKEAEKIYEQIRKKEDEIRELECLNDEVDKFISDVPDPAARSIFECYYTDGNDKVTQKEVADKVMINRGSISGIIDKYLLQN